MPCNTPDRQCSYWWYPIILDTDVLDVDAAGFIKVLQSKNIPCYGILWPEAYLEAAYKDNVGFGEANFPFKSTEYTNPESVKYGENFCPKAHSLRAQTFSLFLHPSWEEIHIQACIDGVKAALAEHLK